MKQTRVHSVGILWRTRRVSLPTTAWCARAEVEVALERVAEEVQRWKKQRSYIEREEG